MIEKFQFAVPSGNTGVPSPQQVGGLTQFLRVRCFLLDCLRNKHHAVCNNAARVYC
jgi:hypothetical protein